jgi:hypothetical protein
VYCGVRRGQKGLVTTGSEERRAVNEATFRDANEQIRKAERELEPPLERVPYLCECDEVGCYMPIQLTASEYEHVRRDGATFVIAPGHSSEGDVVEHQNGYLIVRKADGGGDVARALDPRKEEA